MADQKTVRNELSTLLEVEENVFIYENFHFFTLTYFPIFQDGGAKNIKKGSFYITWGFLH